MRRAKWPRMKLLGRIVLFLVAFAAALILQIVISYYQTNCILKPLEERSENIQAVSQFLNDAEACMSALENYRWNYGDADLLIATVRTRVRQSSDRLERIDMELSAVSEEQYLLANAAKTTYQALCLTLDSIILELELHAREVEALELQSLMEREKLQQLRSQINPPLPVQYA